MSETPITPEDPDIPEDPPPAEDGSPEEEDQPMGVPADMDPEDAPLPGHPGERAASGGLTLGARRTRRGRRRSSVTATNRFSRSPRTWWAGSTRISSAKIRNAE